MFVDQIRIQAKAGDGGNGCVSFRREKFVPKGGPDGGDGGKGGDIILRTDIHKDNLVDFYYQPILRAKRGEHGLGKNMYGKSGADSIYKVPIGTVVYRIPPQKLESVVTEEDSPTASAKIRIDPADCQLVVDLTEKDQEFILCRGGAGGKGNTHFKSSRNRVPRQFTEGEPGEDGFFLLELRTIADAGLVGYPNAGKSTLLSKISAAHPKIAPYPFTTLNPMIGVVEFPGYLRGIVADIPGLIEGAHRNVGLGHDFLRHIVRCKLLIFVLDAAGSEGRTPLADLGSLRRELGLYDPKLSNRPWIIVANKMDLPGAEENLRLLQQRLARKTIVPMSAERDEGVANLKAVLERLLIEERDEASQK
ncbi:MAG TPA: GTPase ObgE [Chthoniobacterales bacterium]|jgi:GTP-binding protein|nr:GTPase ObgE [Chthoniobacterales bacterium]